MRHMNVSELLGILGGALFFISWVLQAWETKKANKAVVSLNFFLIRLIASICLVIESIRVKSYGLILVTGGTILIILYNIYVIKSKNKNKSNIL